MAKYKFIHNGKETICISSYAKKTVKGIAKANPRDVYDKERGELLAKTRCDYKVAQKRVKNAASRLAEAENLMRTITEYHGKMLRYYDDAIAERTMIKNSLESLLESL